MRCKNRAMNRARQLTLLALALLVVLFAATWLTLPTERTEALGKNPVNYPARLFAHGILDEETCRGFNNIRVDCQSGQYEPGANRARYSLSDDEVKALERRLFVLFAAAAALIVLVGFAFGAARR